MTPSPEPTWWWKVALHLDEAQSALVNALTYNVDDPRRGQALQDKICEGQTILLEIFRAKGLLPASGNGVADHSETPAGPPPPPPIDMPAPSAGWTPGSWVQAESPPAQEVAPAVQAAEPDEGAAEAVVVVPVEGAIVGTADVSADQNPEA